MATRVAGGIGGRGARALVAKAGVAVVLAAVLAGCDNEDPGAQAISDASIQLRTISPGSVAPVSDEFATKGYRATAGELGPASSGSAAQQAVAALLSAQVETGLARPALSRLVEIEHEIASKLNRMVSLETARVSAQQTAAALGSYDPAAERRGIDSRTSELQQQLSEAQAKREQLEQRVAALGTQIDDLEGQVGGIRAQESSLRDQALRQDPIEAAQSIEEARETGRRADGLEVRASTLDAERSVLRPQVEAAGVRIDAINAQLAILSEARESVAQQARRSADDASAAQASAREFSAELVTLATEIMALHKDEAQASVSEARQSLEKAASAARRASGGAADGTLAAAGASRILGDVLARRAMSMEQTASAFRGLADRGQGELASRLTAQADELSQQAQGMKRDAIAAYETAAGNLRRAKAQGATRDALQAAADDLDRAIERLGGRVAGSDEPEESDDMGSGEDTGDETAEMGG
ncbi:MAG: hypothetical protein ACIAQU_02395 [Phycisphaerales bacterium JB064]